MLKIIDLKLLTLAAICSIVVVSYSEKIQKNSLMPLRNFLLVPEKKLTGNSHGKLPVGMVWKASKDGYYVNPYGASSSKKQLAREVLASDCNVKVEEQAILLEYAAYFSETAELKESGSREFALWSYPINFSYGMKPGWVSGMAQAHVALLLGAASRCEPKYEHLYQLAINSMTVNVDQGGVRLQLDEGSWFEEYAQPNSMSPMVLNGHIYAVLALEALAGFDSHAEALSREGMAALRNNLPRFDAVTWSYYDTVGTPANNVYQQPLHARQMRELYELTGEQLFLDYHRKFTCQLYSPFSSIQRFILAPTNFLGGLLIMDFVLFYILFMFVKRKVQRRKHSK